jgi:hypothetical protein
MTAQTAAADAVWENPLIPNNRLKQIYLAMMQAQAIAKAAGRKPSGAGLEACLVSPAIDLHPGDLISDALSGGVIDFLRGPLTPRHRGKLAPLQADCGAASSLISPTGAERIWTALGAAAALQALPPRQANTPDATAKESSVAVIYLRADELTPATRRNALTFAATKKLPAIFLILPTGKPRAQSSWANLALRCGLPGIPTDADDAIAIYRVAQESIGHARIGGGPALIECIPFQIEGVRKRRGPSAVASLEQYLLHRRIADAAWIGRQQRSFALRVKRTLTPGK